MSDVAAGRPELGPTCAATGAVMIEKHSSAHKSADRHRPALSSIFMTFSNGF
jgi:hypothetical protein